MNKMFIKVVHVTNIFSGKQDFKITIYRHSISKLYSKMLYQKDNALQ